MPRTRRARADVRAQARQSFASPCSTASHGRLGRRLATAVGQGQPAGRSSSAFCSPSSRSRRLDRLGLLLTQVLLLTTARVGRRALFGLLALPRSSGLTDASLIGSMIAGGVVLPIVAGVTALAAALARQWRVVGFLVFALALEAGVYRATTLVVHRERPGRPPPRRAARGCELLLGPHRRRRSPSTAGSRCS